MESWRGGDEGVLVENGKESEKKVEELGPHFQLPKPEAPWGINSNIISITPPPIPIPIERSQSLPGLRKLFLEKSSSFSAALLKRLSSLNETNDDVTQFNLSGLKVIVKLNTDDTITPEFEGRITFFSRSNCRDCKAVRSFFRERRLRYVEINIDVFPTREQELIDRTGTSSVPQIFFNENLVGGLVALNSLRNSGTLEDRMNQLLSNKCPPNAPPPPIYGFDDPHQQIMDEMLPVVKVLRQRLPIQDRIIKLKFVNNCFSGTELVDLIVTHFLHRDRNKAVQIGKQLVGKHFIHHVFGENEFEDGNHYFRFLEHEPFIPKCFNFQGSTIDSEPKAAAMISQRITKILSAILDSYATDDRHHLDYVSISKSEEFRRYISLARDLQRVNILELTADEKLAFFLNLYNAMVIHAAISVGHPDRVIDRRSFYSDFLYVVGGHSCSLTTLKNGILRSNRRAPYSLVKPFGARDKRLEVALPKVNPLIHFGLCNGTRSSPTVRFFTPQGVESELRHAAREFFLKDGIEVNLANRTVYLTRIIKWFDVDFGQEKEILKWILNYLDATKAGLLTHLLGDGGPVRIVYQDYDWSVNC